MKNPFEYGGVVSGNGIFPVCQAWHCPLSPRDNGSFLITDCFFRLWIQAAQVI